MYTAHRETHRYIISDYIYALRGGGIKGDEQHGAKPLNFSDKK